jgi:uncharacterized membrane protein YkvA (DUF1232 family)
MSVLEYLLEELAPMPPLDKETPQDTKLDPEKKSKVAMAIDKFKAGITKDTIPDLIAKIESGIPKMSPALRGPAKDILGLVGMVNDWVTGQYKALPWETILTIIAALRYVVSPVDVIPDVVPVAGVIDDVFLITKVLPAIQHDVAKYKEWKSQQGNPQELKRKKRLQ